MVRTARFHQGLGQTGASEWFLLARETHFGSSRLAHHLGVSDRHLRRILLARLGRQPQEWLDEQRMISARILIFELDQLKSLGSELGFKDQSTFNKHFRKCYGCTPSQFKSKMSVIAMRFVLARKT